MSRSAKPFLLAHSLALVALLTAGCVTPGEPSRGHPWAEGWRELSTPHFRLRTNLEPDEARTEARDLEQLRAALLRTWGDHFDPPGQVDVTLFASVSQLAAFTGAHSAGFTEWRGSEARMVMALPDLATPDLQGTQVQAHELTHYLSLFVLLRQPRWVAEGFACYFESATLDKAEAQVIFGMPSPHMIGLLRRFAPLPLSALWGWKGGIGEENEGALYAASFAWVHYLLNIQTRRFADFQRRLMLAEEPQEAFNESFRGVDRAALERGLQTYLRSPLPAQTAPFAAVTPTLSERHLPAAQVHALFARLWLRTRGPQLGSERRGYGETELRYALAEDPAELEAAELAAELAPRKERLGRVRALAKAHPDRAEAWSDLASVLAAEGGAPAERDQALRRSLALRPDDAQTLDLFALAALERNVPSEAVAPAERAAALAPWSAGVLEVYAAALAGVHRCEEASRVEERARDLLGVQTHPRSRELREGCPSPVGPP